MPSRRPSGSGGGGGGGGGSTKTITQVEIGTAAEAAPLAQDSSYSVAHGLGGDPDIVELCAECTTAEQGYAVGDVVVLNTDKDRTVVWSNATHVGFDTHVSRGTPLMVARSNQDTFNLTAANWTVRAIPYKFVDETVAASGGSAVTTKESVELKQYGTTFEHLSISRDDNSQSAHGLSKAPDGIDAYLECTTADLGYSVGDRVDYAYTTRGLLWYDDTNVGWAGYSQRPYITHKSSNSESEIGDNDWKAVAKPFIQVNQDVVTKVEGGGGGGGGTFLTPETDEGIAFVEADEHNIININGKLYEVIRDLHAGHGKTVGLEELTHVNFRGFIASVNEVLSPADGQFVYVYSESLGVAAGFERYTTAGVTGFYPYRPFDSGNEWENAPTGFNYTGALNYRGYRQDEVDLIRVAAAAGEVFVLLDERQVMFVDEFTAAIADYTIFKKRNVVPVGQTNNPRAYFWLNGQTERDYQGAGDENFPFVATPVGTAELLIVRFVGANPDQAYDNGDVIYADTVTTIGTTTLNGLTLPMGRHDVSVVLESNDDVDIFTSAFWKRDVGGADDRYVSGLYRGETDHNNPVLGVTAGIHYTVTDVVTDGTEVFYLALMGVGTAAIRLRGHVVVEYKGAA